MCLRLVGIVVAGINKIMIHGFFLLFLSSDDDDDGDDDVFAAVIS